MPTSQGTGFTSGAGGWTGTHVPLPEGPTKYRREPRKPFVSPIVLRDPAPVVELAPAPKPKVRRGAPGIDPAKVAEIVRLYVDEGLGIKDVGTKVELSFTTVKKYLHREGVEIRPRGGRRLVEPKLCPVCGRKFERRANEKSAPWKKRLTCGRRCGGLLTASKRFGS